MNMRTEDIDMAEPKLKGEFRDPNFQEIMTGGRRDSGAGSLPVPEENSL